MLSGNVTHLVTWQMEIYMVTPNDFNGFCLKWDLELKIKLYKVTVSARLLLRALKTEEILWQALGDSTETLQQ